MSENRNRRSGGGHGPGGRGPAEKPKNFRSAMGRLFKELRPFHVLILLSIVLAVGGSVLSISAPSYLSDMTDVITEGITPNTDALYTLQDELTASLSEENIQSAVTEIMDVSLDQETIQSILMDENISEEDKLTFQTVLASMTAADSNSQLAALLTLPDSVLAYILPESTYNGVTFTTSDKISLITGLSSGAMEVSDPFYEALLSDIEIDGVTISVADQIECIKVMQSADVSDTSDTSAMTSMLDELPDSISELISPAMDLSRVYSLARFLLCLYLLSALFTYIQARAMAKVSNEFARTLRTSISEKINRLPLKYFDSHQVGDTLSRVTNDVDTVSQALSQSLATFVSSVVLFVGTIIMMFVTNAQLALTAILSTILGFVLMFVILGKSQKYFSARQKVLGALNGHIEETYSSLNVVRAYNGSKQADEKFNDLNNQMFNANWKSQFLSGLMQPLMSFIGNFGYVAVCVVGAILASNGTITFGVIVAFITYVRMFTSPLSQIAQAMTSLQSATAASERVFAFVDEEEMSDESAKTARIEKRNVEGNIDFENVVFTYAGNQEPTIHHFSASAKHGQKIAIVGPTGAGKTTMVNLLMRFYDIDSGSIKIDGVSTLDMKREDLRDLFTMVLQDTWLFEGTIRENIVYNREGIDDAEVMQAVKMAGLEHYINTLPNGLDTVLDNSESVSSGQRQLITIARAMLTPTPFLILDEATSNVDTRTEEVIQEAMDRLSYGKTSFIIAHRLSTIRNADMILVMRDGNIVEQGNHEELIAKNGFYAELYNSQFEL